MTQTADEYEAVLRVDQARRGLIERGWRCLAGGKFGLPSYTDIEAWSKGGRVIYFIYDRKNGDWDILAQVDTTNTFNGTWKAVEEIGN